MEFVTFEIAKKLKEKGFPQHWSNDYIVENDYEDEFEVGYHYDRCFIPEHLPTIATPTISQVLKWLRNVKKLYVEPCILTDTDADSFLIFNKYSYWNFAITHIETGEMLYFEKYEHTVFKRFDSYEQAVFAGIEYVLDNLI